LALVDGTNDAVPLLISSAITLTIGSALLITTRGKVELRTRDGFLIVTLGWLVAALFGSLPYILSGVCEPIDALFESMSGFTTTGATILGDIESLPRGILLWRSLTQWMGGIGIVLLAVVVLPHLGVGGMQLYRVEAPGAASERLFPRIQNAAKALWVVYLGLTLAETVLLIIAGLSVFDAICHSFCTIATAGFSTKNASVGAFESPYVQWIVVFFMFIAGANFSLHLGLVRGGRRGYFRNEEFRLYSTVAVIACALLWADLVLQSGEELLHAAPEAVFQAVSILTTTGFTTADYGSWRIGPQVLLFLMMFLGGCAGSTSGGMKLMRLIVLAKHGLVMAKKLIHPRAIFPVRFNGKVVPQDVITRVLDFFLLYIFVFFIFALLLALMGLDFKSALSSSIATLGNIGPALGGVGPVEHYGWIPGGAKLLMCLAMILGRLEIYTVLVVFMPMFWKRN
jgi:trk system potassium uptake protein TrkH